MRNFQKRRKKNYKKETDSEKFLEKNLKKLYKNNEFIKQYPIGPYIVDFYFPKVKVVVEADGGQHYTEKGLKHDQERRVYLEKMGITTIRFNNREILNKIEVVIKKIHLLICINYNNDLNQSI